MSDTMTIRSARLALLLSLAASPLAAMACQTPVTPTFMDNLDHASHVYVFRLMSLEVGDRDAWYSTLNGRINVVRILKGGTPKTSGLSYSISCCNPRLMVGRYYLAAVSSDTTTLELIAGDQSIIDVSDDFNTTGGAGTSGAIEPVQQHLAGQPLPADFPGEYRLEATVACTLPPPRI
jgi:hypothetical protein